MEWYQNYFEARAMPKIGEDMGECQGFFQYLADQDPGMYARITDAQDEIDALRLSRAEKKTFKDACGSFYFLLMEAKKGFDAWKARQREAAKNVGKQEAMRM